MIIGNFTLKIIFFCGALIFLSNCTDSNKAAVKGENQAINIADSLETSVEQQELPNVWLEFEQEDGQTSKTDLGDKSKEKLYLEGKSLFRCKLVINHSDNYDERYAAVSSAVKTILDASVNLENTEIASPNGKRKLTAEEVKEILHKQTELINDRYYELDDYFYPKSAFYKFKRFVNEKLSYSIF